MSTPQDWVYFWAAMAAGWGLGFVTMLWIATWVTRDRRER